MGRSVALVIAVRNADIAPGGNFRLRLCPLGMSHWRTGAERRSREAYSRDVRVSVLPAIRKDGRGLGRRAGARYSICLAASLRSVAAISSSDAHVLRRLSAAGHPHR